MKTKQLSTISKASVLSLFVALLFAFNACKPTEENYAGYRLIEKRFVKEVNADVYYFEHIKSGAHVVKIASNDQNKTFGIGFKTEPNSNCGTPHIIEHSVLNGSKNYPVKSPFDELGKTSLKTFLNAFTGADYTFYPVASMNEKDYFNLMGVYLDAVFFPLIDKEPRIFKQEGWHYELTDKKSPIVYKGVVYNEMKGSFSSPYRELNYQTSKNLFPDNGYSLSSGGYPVDMPNLKYEDFIAFYKKNYHPANSCIFIYGNADLKKELELIDTKYLSTFDKVDANSNIKVQKPFTAMKEVVAPYSVMEGTSLENQTYLSINWVFGLKADKKLSMALDVLADVLVGQESAPIRLALQKAGIGKEVYAYNDANQQNTFTITVQNANAVDKDKFKEIVLSVLKEQSEKGIDKQSIKAYLNRMEFQLREGNDSQKGLSAMLQSFSDWMFTNDPFVGMEWEKPLAQIKGLDKEKYYEQTIKDGMLNNPFCLLLTLEPKPGLEKEISDKTVARLAAYKASLTDVQLDNLVKETKDLISYQQREDSASALACIPKLLRSDLNKEANWYEVTEKEVANSKVIHYDDFTNGVIYANVMFNLETLPSELLPYASLLTELLGTMPTQKYTFSELEKEIKINTGNFYANLNTWLENNDDGKMIPKFILASKAMNESTPKMFELMTEVLTKTNFKDKERLKTVLTRLQSNLEANVKNNGMNYAMTRSFSYFSNKGMFDEITGGFEYYWFVNKIVADFDKNSDEVIANIEKTAKMLFTKNNMMVGTTCDTKDYSAFEAGFNTFASTLPVVEEKTQPWNFQLSKKNEGFVSTSKVQYVVKSFNFKQLGYTWNGKINVLNSIISSEWLQNKIRVIGGAYGGFSGFSPDGTVYFASYRDPNLKETLDNYDGTVGYLNTFKADEEKMLGYIIGTISDVDYPLTASQKGNVAYGRYFKKYTKEQLQAERDAILSTTDADIRGMEKMVKDVLSQNLYCVYGNKEKIETNKKLFNKIMTLDNK